MRSHNALTHPRSWLAVLALVSLGGLAIAQDSKPTSKPAPLTIDDIRGWLKQKGIHDPYTVTPPLGFSEDDVKKHVPADNPLTRAKVELGRQLYFDTRLSKDNTVSCATCHHPRHGFSDGARTSTGIKKQVGDRNSPTVTNRLFSRVQFWDGRAKSLEEQALGPIGNPIEMGSSVEQACKTLNAIPGYKLQVKAVFGADEITGEHIAKAIAAFERTVVSGNSPWDVNSLARDYAQLDLEDEDLEPALKARVEAVIAAAKKRPLSAAAQRGEKLFFGKANCSLCHTGANFTDELYHNLGVGMAAEKPDWGRFKVTNEEKDKGAFKTPTLRNIADTAPYMHDGKQETLLDVVKFYNQGGEKNKWLSERIKPLELTDQEMADLVAFMEALSGEVSPVTEPRLPE